jgi:hypothetical protein
MRCDHSATSARPAGASCPPDARPCRWWHLRKGRDLLRPRVRLPVRHVEGLSLQPRGTRVARAIAPALAQAIEVARRKAFVIVDGLLRIDRVGMASGYALTTHEIPAVADTAYQGAGPTVAVPQRRRRVDPGAWRAASATSNRAGPTTRPGRAGQRRAEELAHLAQDPLHHQPHRHAHRRSSTLRIATRDQGWQRLSGDRLHRGPAGPSGSHQGWRG